MGEAKKVASATAVKPAVFSGERQRDRRVRALAGVLIALAIIASFLTGVLVGISRQDRQLVVQAEFPVEIVVNPAIYIEQQAAATSAEAILPAEAPIVEANCPEGTSQIPEWAPGLCGDEAFLALAAGQAQGEIVGPGSGVLVILSENVEDHCYGGEATFWPLTPGVNGSIPVARDYPATVEFPAGRWGLGGATECTP